MTQRDPRVDAYIAKAAPFAQPLLTWMRDTTHAACAELTEDIKWGMPFFVHQGRPVGVGGARGAGLLLAEVADRLGQVGARATPEGDDRVDGVAPEAVEQDALLRAESKGAVLPLGAREGQSVQCAGGRVSRSVTVERIEYQPERERHFDR